MFGRTLRALTALALSAFAICAQAQDIVIGQIGPFTGLPSPDAHEIRDGARAYFDQVNQSGGLRGRKLSLFTLDDTFKGDVFLERFKEAMAKRPVALISPIGSAAMTKLLKEGALDAADIVIVNAIPGSEAFRHPGHPKLFHIRAGDKAQLDKILLHCKTLGIVRLHVVYQDLPIGEAGLGAVKVTAQAMGGMTIDATLSKHSDEALQAAAKAAAAQAPQGVIVIGSPKFMADAVSQLRKAGIKQAAFALSYLPTPLAVKVIGEDGARGDVALEVKW
jgi:branched-chain amino acid transport system substrate-binding protein